VPITHIQQNEQIKHHGS